ncbi:hypothetical protein OS188_05085 [Xanthomarina sp. F1114]|uniref:LamG-like jellyroll fold domain-containing protein n=1 Tax=Xanthomarina sp. F1114 TaxID=2996019 RepID=UPI00225E508D|nr:LamG-like jellyroll fold domain-containing protein [Xanthomarina sp. F1114]MCX7547324.1 hypothetical protein [Xanthomarina sp. F1114]
MNKVKIVLVSILGLIISCTENNEEIVETTITISDLITIINENPDNDQYIGSIEASTNQGTIIYSITEQNPSGALKINSSNGEIRVLDQTLFDFEINPSITGTIKVENEGVSDTADLIINLTNTNDIDALDFVKTLEGIPSVNQSLGVIEATTSQGDLTFSMIEQSPNQILEINSLTGEVIIQHVPNFMGNPIITGTARIENGETFKDIDIIINIVQPCNTTTVPVLNAFYPLNSNAMDESGFDNHGSVSGAVLTTNRFSEVESAYYFDGIDDNIQIQDNEQLFFDNEFTISAWVFPQAIKTQQILRKGTNVNGTSSWPYGLGLSATNEVVFSVTAGGVLYQARKQGYNMNQWYLITGVLKDQKIYLYVNEELVAIEEIEGEIFNDSLPLIIGTRLSIPSSTFKGKIDDVRIYNAALCQEDITDLFNN